MLTMERVKVPSYDGRGGRETALRVTVAATGEVRAFCRRLPFESRATWEARAMLRGRLAA